MSKTTKIVLGVLTFLPLVVLILFASYTVYQIASFWAAQDHYMPMFLFPYLGYALPFMFLFGLFNLGLIIFYLIQISQNNFLDTEKKFLWIVVVIILNNIMMPIYWYIHIWKEKLQEPKLTSTFKAHEPTRTRSQEF